MLKFTQAYLAVVLLVFASFGLQANWKAGAQQDTCLNPSKSQFNAALTSNIDHRHDVGFASLRQDEYGETIRPIIEEYCISCHAPGDMEGLDFLVPETQEEVDKFRSLFAGVVEQIENRTMPPMNCDQLTEEERELVVNWFKNTLDLKPDDTDRIAPYVVEIYEDKQGSLWFGTVQNGTARYDGETLTYFSTTDGLPSNAVTSFAEDNEGNLWVGTHAGVCRFDGQTFTRMGVAVGLPAPSRPSPMAWSGVSVDRAGNLWASVGKSAYRFEGESFEEFEVPIKEERIESYAIVSGSVSLSLEDRAGNLWFATDGDGAYKFDGKSFTHFTKKDGLCSNNVNGILEDKTGNIWFACMQSYQPKMTGDGGVCLYDGEKFKHFPEIQGLSNNDIYTIFETRSGDVWIGAPRTGAYRYDGEAFTLFAETDRAHWTRNFGIQSILEDRRGTLWFGFSGGLFRFDGNSFFNVKKSGPWIDLATAMKKVILGDDSESNWLHSRSQAALSAMAEDNFDEAKTILLELKQAEPKESSVQENTINEVGYHLIWDDQLPLAIKVLELNTQLHPAAFNTFDSLAEAHLRSGNEQLAAKYYRKSLELNPQNAGAAEALLTMAARQKYEDVLVAPEGWMEEVLVVPPSFAPTMSLEGLEHLRLPPGFRDPDSDWFISYLFAIELTQPAELNERMLGEQLLTYFRGLASGGSDEEGTPIDTDKFSIESNDEGAGDSDDEYTYVLTWQEPFTNATLLKQNLRVKVITGKQEHGIVFICGSPQPFDSEVWSELIRIRESFESADIPSDPLPKVDQSPK